MTFSEKIDAIKSLLKIELSEPAPIVDETQAAAVELATITGSDGMIYKCSGDLAEGVELTAVTPEGDKPAPDGSIELEDGTVLTVAGGKVTAITAPVAPVVVEETKEDMTAKFEAIVAPLKAEIETLKQALFEATEANKTEAKSLREAFGKTLDIVNEMNTTPATRTPKPIVGMFTKEENENRATKVAEAIIAAKKQL